TSCAEGEDDPFAATGAHYNPEGCPHPYHKGDLPPLFGADGVAISAFLSDRFSVSEVLGKTVVLHSAPDDFTTQPAGGAGEKIACGVILPTKR
ncbi:MAG: superoxide dismutase family protein, partial [Clostridia bacterium]|nr:superoxide dismutase family protein [Clostridia bacterium]